MPSWTKRQIILAALTEIGIASYAFDSTADQLQNALQRLDVMMGVWQRKGIVFVPDPYPISTDPSVTDLDEDTNAPEDALEAMILNLAVRIAPSYGKKVMQDTKFNAKFAYNTLLGGYSVPSEYSLGTFLKGAGNKDPLYPWQNSDTVEDEEVVVTP